MRKVKSSVGSQIAALAVATKMEHRPAQWKATMQGVPRDYGRADAKLRKF